MKECHISFLDNPLVSKIVFYPRKSDIPSNLGSNIFVLKFQISDQISIGGFFFLKDKKLPSILLFHGNGEIAQDYFQFKDNFLDLNVNFGVVDYRGYGFSSGTPFFSSLFNDALPIFNNFTEMIKKNGLFNSIFVMGRSLGSVCASEIGAQNPPNLNGIIYESGYASIYNLMTKLFQLNNPVITPDSLMKWSNEIRMKKIRKPIFIIHGMKDQLIPFSEAELIKNAVIEGVEKILIPVQNAGHNDLFMFYQEYSTQLREFIYRNS